MTIAVISMIREPWGGSEEIWYQLAKSALQKGHSVIHLSYENPVQHFKTKELINAGVKEYTRPGWIPQGATGFRKLFYIGRNYIRKKISNPFNQIQKHSPDIILYNGTAYSIANENLLLNYIEKNKGKACFYILAHINNDYKKEIDDIQAGVVRKAYQLARKVFFVAQRTIAVAQRDLNTDIPNAALVRNPVNMMETGVIKFNQNAGDNIQMAVVGNLTIVHKGQDLLITVLSSDKWRQRNWTLNIYGDGADKNYLSEMVRSAGLENKIVFHGKTSDIRGIWEKNQILVMPSLMEGMPLAIVEAMLCGRTCVATDVGGITEWITDNETGFIAPYSTVESIDEALERAWQRKDEWEEMGRKAFNDAIKLYDADAGNTLLNYITV